MLLMALYTNIKPLFYINIWNVTDVIEEAEADNTNDSKLRPTDIIIIVNLLVLAVVGKQIFSKHKQVLELLDFTLLLGQGKRNNY